MAEGDSVPVAETVPPTEAVPEPQSTEAQSKLEADIIRQVEYYFGDANLARDKFMQEQIGKNEGWVDLSVLLTFKRLAALSEDKAVIVAAVSKSDEGLVEVSEDKEKLRRHPERPLPEQNVDTRKEMFERMIYAKGFPVVETFGIEQLLEYFKPLGKAVANVQMRKYHDKPTKLYKFKGSVFVTFATKDQAQEYMTQEKVEYEGKELLRMWRNDYMEKKKAEYADITNKKKAKKESEEEAAFKLPSGALLKLEQVAKATTRESIKAKMAELGGEVSFVEFSTGDELAVVRLKEENAAKELFASKIEGGKLSLDDQEVTVTVIEGDEEAEFLKKAIENMKQRRANQKHKGGRGNRGHGKYHHHNNKKRSGSPGRERPAKVAKVE